MVAEFVLAWRSGGVSSGSRTVALARARVARYPCSTRVRYAVPTVVLLVESAIARSRSLGMAEPSERRPSRTSSRSLSERR